MKLSLQILLVLLIPALAVALMLAACHAQEDDQRVDRATDGALEWLERKQMPDGAWPAGENRKNAAVTSLALMAFMAKVLRNQVRGERQTAYAAEGGPA